jgi:hypothetical protein
VTWSSSTVKHTKYGKRSSTSARLTRSRHTTEAERILGPAERGRAPVESDGEVQQRVPRTSPWSSITS